MAQNPDLGNSFLVCFLREVPDSRRPGKKITSQVRELSLWQGDSGVCADGFFSGCFMLNLDWTWWIWWLRNLDMSMVEFQLLAWLPVVSDISKTYPKCVCPVCLFLHHKPDMFMIYNPPNGEPYQIIWGVIVLHFPELVERHLNTMKPNNFKTNT